MVDIGAIIVIRIFRIDLCIPIIIIVEIFLTGLGLVVFSNMGFPRKNLGVLYLLFFLAFYYHYWCYYLVIWFIPIFNWYLGKEKFVLD